MYSVGCMNYLQYNQIIHKICLDKPLSKDCQPYKVTERLATGRLCQLCLNQYRITDSHANYFFTL